MLTFRMIMASAVISSISLPTYAFFPNEEDIREWCDSGILSPVEGIWEYPEDGARVCIQADPSAPGCYALTIISTPDCRLDYGDVIGRLHPTIDSKQFRLEQFTHKDKLNLTKPEQCAATLSADGESLRVKSPKLKIKINIRTLLPKFWRTVRISYDDPTDKLPAGLVKVYPGYDHNGSLRRKTRIL